MITTEYKYENYDNAYLHKDKLIIGYKIRTSEINYQPILSTCLRLVFRLLPELEYLGILDDEDFPKAYLPEFY